MSTVPISVFKTLSKQQVARLQNLGATVTDTTITATEDQMWKARITGKLRELLEVRGNMAMSSHFP